MEEIPDTEIHERGKGGRTKRSRGIFRASWVRFKYIVRTISKKSVVGFFIKWGFIVCISVASLLFFKDKERFNKALQTLLEDFGGWTQVFAVLAPVALALLLQFGRKGFRGVKDLTRSQIFTEVVAGWLGFWFVVFIFRFTWPVEDEFQLLINRVTENEHQREEILAHIWDEPIGDGNAYVALGLIGNNWNRISTTLVLQVGENSEQIRVVFLQENAILRRISDQEAELQTQAKLNVVMGNASINTFTNLPYMQVFIPRTNITKIKGGIMRISLNSKVLLEYELPVQDFELSESGNGVVLEFRNIPKRITITPPL